jgi:hypothetical protein
MDTPQSRWLPLVPIIVVAALFVSVFATSNRQTRYAPIGSFDGCYADRSDRLLLRADGGIEVNGTAAGSYRIVKPVGGKHGYLVEAKGLKLSSGRGAMMRSTKGTGGFHWRINDEAIDVTFAPDVTATLKKVALSSC